MSFFEYQNQNPEFLNNYLKYIRLIQFNASTTVDEEYFDLRTFFRYVKLILIDKLPVENISSEDFKKVEIKNISFQYICNIKQETITNYLYFLRYTLNNCPKTRNRKLNSLKKFFNYLFINNLIAYNPTLGIKTAKVEKRQAKYLDLNESKTLLAKTINSKQRYIIRNYAILCLFLNCSIRLSELVNIDLVDLKLDDKTLKIKGKGNMERIIYLNDATFEAIVKYLEIRPKLTKENKYYQALFISSQNKRISKRSVQNMVEKIISVSFQEEKSKLSAHSLRHTSATLMYSENNTDILVIKEILGHKSINSTQIYTHVSEKKLKDIMNNCTISSILEKMEELNNEKK